MNVFQIWYFAILLLIQIQLGFLASKWYRVCEKMLAIRYKVMESPSKAHKELCKRFSDIKHESKQHLFF